MKRWVQLASLLLLAGAVVWIWMQLSPNPERKIRARVVELEGLVSFRAADGNLATLSKLQQLGSLFTRDAQVQVDAPGSPGLTLTGRDRIMQAARGAGRVVGDLDVQFKDITITLGRDSQSAVVEAIGQARGPGYEGVWIQQLRFSFLETENGWLISRVETVRTFTGADPDYGPVSQRLRRA